MMCSPNLTLTLSLSFPYFSPPLKDGNYVVGSAALKSTLRAKASSSNKGCVLPSASVLNNLNTPESNAFFAHLRDLAANASGLGLKSTDMLRVVLSVPDSTSEEKIGEIVKAVGSGFGKVRMGDIFKQQPEEQSDDQCEYNLV